MTTTPGQAVLAEQLSEAIDGRTVRAAVFTTFCFDPGFFDAEILTCLFDRAWAEPGNVRQAQLEHELRPLSGRVAVYYDEGGLLDGDLPATADVLRVPIPRRPAFFHPKTVAVLVDDGPDVRSLITVTSSANLTPAGWWRNVEAAVIQEFAVGARTRCRDGLLEFYRHIRRRTRAITSDETAPLNEVISFLDEEVDQLAQRSHGGELRSHFHWKPWTGGSDLPGFFNDTVRGAVAGWDLDVISPYTDADAGAGEPTALKSLVDTLQPGRVSVFLPEFQDEATVSEDFYDFVAGHETWAWGRLPAELVAAGGDRAPRRVHAKVYRFFKGKREIVYVGSANLTRPGFSGDKRAGNIEAGVILERHGDAPQRSWLTTPIERPEFFNPADEQEEARDRPVPLVLRYDWAAKGLKAFWNDGKRDNPELVLRAHDVDVTTIRKRMLGQEEWTPIPLSSTEDDNLRARLQKSSIVHVTEDDGEPVAVPVLDVNRSQRPSAAGALTPAEILEYWSLLTADERATFLEERLIREVATDEASAPGSSVASRTVPESMFDRFAGVFQAFEGLRERVFVAIEEDRHSEAEVLVTGDAPDTLRGLLEALVDDRDAGAPEDRSMSAVDAYLVFLCAEQLTNELRKRESTFWEAAAGVAIIDDLLAHRTVIRREIIERSPNEDLGAFLDWYESHFLEAVPRAG